MPRRPDFIPTPSEKGWMISTPANMSPTGKRVREYFRTEKEALKAAGALRAKYHSGQRGGLITHDLAMAAVEAMNLLEPHGLTLIEVARAAVARIEAGVSLETFRERYDRVMHENETHWRPAHALNMARLPRWVGKDFMKLRLADITRPMIEAALRALGSQAQSTVDARMTRINSIINYQTKHRKTAEIAILSLAQCRQFFRACESPPERWAVALLLFAGIRPSAEDGEISRLDWSNVGKTEIYIPANVSKTGSDRRIPISDRLRRLLRGHPETGCVTPANWRRVYKRLRAAVDGIYGKQDVARHTFASHFLAAYGEKLTKSAMGHTAGSDTLFRHYRRAINEADGIKYFR